MSEVNLVEAIRMALARAMEEDPSVLVLGEDVGRDGGVFRATDGLLARFGAARVFDTPVSEALLAGLAVGLGAQRFRPVVEFQFEGFMYPAIDQLVSHAGRLRNRTRGPAVVPDRAPRALRRRHQGARAPLREPRGVLRPHPGHSRRHPVLAAHRLRPAARGDPRPGSGRLPRAQADLPRAQGALADDGEALPLDRCFVVREGRDVTLVSWGALLARDARGRRCCWPARGSRRP